MTICGRRGLKEDLGNTTFKNLCPRCNNEVTYKRLDYCSKFTLFFIPLFPFNKKVMVDYLIFIYEYDGAKD